MQADVNIRQSLTLRECTCDVGYPGKLERSRTWLYCRPRRVIGLPGVRLALLLTRASTANMLTRRLELLGAPARNAIALRR
jgi:hypothetical protein